MPDQLSQRYPIINRFVLERGWIEVGFDDYSQSFIRALDPGGLVWEGKESYNSLDDALVDLERGLARWMKDTAGTEE